MDSQKQQIVEKLQASNNILLTVSRDPSVDQLAACIALTILLNKLDKHATAVFSGNVPSTIDFLKPEETLEKNTDSLRDFIIALDKSKADKLRYKVEDRVVKIFITPYKTSLSSDDLEFSQGDFNVDVVLALGVHQQADLDDAITAHGRILHDATVMCVNTTPNGDLGSVNWVGQNASSLSELATELAKSFDKPLLDEQVSTALLTGIVSETDRFKNDKTTATTMSLSADLMKAGANQQLVADELEPAVRLRDQPTDQQSDKSSRPNRDDTPADKPAKAQDGTLEITHPDEEEADDNHDTELPAPVDDGPGDQPEPENDDKSQDAALDFASRTRLNDVPDKSPKTEPRDESANDNDVDSLRTLITQPPTFGGTLTANSRPEDMGLSNISMLPTDEQTQNSGAQSHRPMTLPVPPSSAADDPAHPSDAPAEAPTPEPALPPAPIVTPAPLPRPSFTPQPVPPQSAPVFTPPLVPAQPPASAPAPSQPAHSETLTELEEAVHSPHVDEPVTDKTSQSAATDVDIAKARDEVMRALNEQPTSLPPIEALNAQPVDLGRDTAAESQTPQPSQPVTPSLPVNAPEQAPFSSSPADKPLDMPLPPSITLPPAETESSTNAPTNTPDSPPPVPPPFMPGH